MFGIREIQIPREKEVVSKGMPPRYMIFEAWLLHSVSQENDCCQTDQSDLIRSCARSMRASAAMSTLRARLDELSNNVDLIHLLLGNSVPVNMQSLASAEQVISQFTFCYIDMKQFI